MMVLRWLVGVALVAALVNSVEGKKRVMPWMCLERCNGTTESIALNLLQVAKNQEVLSAVAFELFNLGANSTLVVNNLTDVAPIINSIGLESWAMVSSYPYPPQFLHWMREVFQNPQPFIDQCYVAAKQYNLTGFNIDWEPTTEPVPQDAVDYANFLNTFSNAMHAQGIKVSVDAATWNPIWNFTLLAQTSLDRVITMGTYTGSPDSWLNQLETAIDQVGIEKLGVGLETVNPNTNQPFTQEEMEWRFNEIEKRGVLEIDIWDMPVPQLWWPLISDFALD